ncbi:serine/threonine-protein kinase [Streptomyces sp. NPDC002328]|uniref:serine/threonine-protein kinase n=1 Tax=Streptomyces sp. NPDC002328 TaxID=3364642 RepID=UPI0036C4DEEE
MNTWAVPGYSESLELGSGASGRVVLAVHERTGVPVAVKYLSESLRTRPGFVRGFRAEAQLLGGLRSPHVVGLYEYVEAARGAAIVMELVDGVSLRSLLRREGPLSPEAALLVLKGSLLGLADAHGVGVVHRDYKPENVLVSPEGASKLVDFGIAVEAGLRAGVAGTPAYMAPEQWTGAPASPAGDVYAATATFFECLTGRKPYTGDHLAELALRHLEDAVPVDEVPEAVRSLVLRGLAKSPQERPTDAAAFVTELEETAVAAYGDDWEERGRGRLASAVALLLLLPSGAREAPPAPADTALTVLPPPAPAGTGWGGLRQWRPTWPGVAVSAVAVLVAVLLTQGAVQGAGANAGRAARALATTSATAAPASGPDDGLPSPSASDSPSSTPTPTTTASASPVASPSGAVTDGTGPGASATTTDPASPPGPSPSWSPSGGATTSAPATPASPAATTDPPTAPAPPAVKDVSVAGFRQTGPDTATATITVTTDGTGPLSLTVGWFSGNSAGQPGGADGAATTLRRSGATQYTVTVDHAFRGTGCYWTVQAATSPASADGGASQQLLTRRCDIR